MVFCAYCGQNFKRKEHLERHIPSHTNVKPYRCDSCQLSFARKDLLQKHHSTYHEVQDHSHTTGEERAKSLRTPIACTKCASAKAACDKKVPCSRCIDKNLPCDARFARRSSKMAIRESNIAANSKPRRESTDSSRVAKGPEVIAEIPVSVGGGQFLQEHINPDLMMWENSQKMSVYPLQGLQYTDPVDISPPSCDIIEGGNIFLRGGVDMDSQGLNFEEIQMWGNYAMDGGIEFSNNVAMPFLPFPSVPFKAEDSSNASSIPLTSPSLSTSTSHSHLNSNCSWNGGIEAHLQDQPRSPTWLGNEKETVPELDIIVAADDAWPLARCNPPIFSGASPPTALVHLQSFQDCSRLGDAWNSMNLSCPTTDVNSERPFKVLLLAATTRDKIIAIAQSFLHKALRTHQTGVNGLGNSKPGGAATFFTLPSSSVMESLLGNSVRSLSPYYRLFHGLSLDPNELLIDNDTSTLLFLLMIAQGANMIPKAEARNLGAGLTETCRISLFDVIEKNVELSSDPVVLKSALLFTLLGAWGGDAWHMNIAMGQRGMYLSMLKHSGMLEPQASILPSVSSCNNIEPLWREWKRRDHIYRLVYNWAMIDQELSLFHDTAPILSITDLQTPLPESELLWRAENSLEWLQIFHEQSANPSSGFPASQQQAGLSLSHLFQDLLRDELDVQPRRLSPFRLRLLLHPLQSLVCHLGQLLSCFSGMHDNHPGSRPPTTASTFLRLEEAQSSLEKWYDLCMLNAKETPDCAITNGSLILWHLINLNTITYFPSIEKLVRARGFDDPSHESILQSERLIYQPQKAIFHCGQVLRIMNTMPKSDRPTWWSAAIYRATMILLADSICRTNYHRDNEENGPLIMINLVATDDPSIKAYICNFYGVPALWNRDGSYTKLGRPDELLTHCISLLDGGISTRFSDGIRRKLQKVHRTWGVNSRRSSL